MFHPAMWNVAELFEHDLPTTNNHVEAWHRRLQTLIAIDHPSFYAYLPFDFLPTDFLLVAFSAF